MVKSIRKFAVLQYSGHQNGTCFCRALLQGFGCLVSLRTSEVGLVGSCGNCRVCFGREERDANAEIVANANRWCRETMVEATLVRSTLDVFERYTGRCDSRLVEDLEKRKVWHVHTRL